MKKIFLISLFCAGALGLGAQSTLRVESGHLKVTGGTTLVLDNTHLHNNGTLQQASGDGFVKLTGGMNVNLLGSGATTFDELLLVKSPGSQVSLQQDKIVVVSKLLFGGGNLNLNNNVVDLLGSGILSLESETSRAFTTGTGYIQRTEDLNAPLAKNPGNLGAIITSTKNLGSTTIRRGHQQQNGVGGAGNNSILRYYDIVPTNNLNLKATLRFHYFDAELNNIPEPMLYQYKSKDNVNWDFVGADARNDLANYVERNNISKFERWTLAIGIAPTITCPDSIVVAANLSRCRASVPFAATVNGGVPAPTITYRIGSTVITSPHIFPKGTTIVSAIASNGVAPDDTCFFTVTVQCGPVTTTQPVTDTREVLPTPLVVTARPNPSASYFTLNLSSGEQVPVSLRVVDVLGREVDRRTNIAPNGVLQLGHRYRPGVYFVQAVQGHQVVVLRLVKGAD